MLFNGELMYCYCKGSQIKQVNNAGMVGFNGLRGLNRAILLRESRIIYCSIFGGIIERTGSLRVPRISSDQH